MVAMTDPLWVDSMDTHLVDWKGCLVVEWSAESMAVVMVVM